MKKKEQTQWVNIYRNNESGYFVKGNIYKYKDLAEKCAANFPGHTYVETKALKPSPKFLKPFKSLR